MAEQPPRNRRTLLKRACLCGTAAVVVLLLVAPWWRGTIDPRLVGMWTVTSGSPPNITQTFTLKANGTSVEEWIMPLLPAPRNRSTVPQFWEVDGDELRFRSYDHRSVSTRAMLMRQSFLSWCLGTTRTPRPDDTYRIVNVTDDSLQLKYTGVRRFPAPEYHLTRVVADQ